MSRTEIVFWLFVAGVVLFAFGIGTGTRISEKQWRGHERAVWCARVLADSTTTARDTLWAYHHYGCIIERTP